MTDNKMIAFIENTLIPDITDTFRRGHKLYTFSCGWQYDSNEIAKAVAERTGYVCKPAGGVVYFVRYDFIAMANEIFR